MSSLAKALHAHESGLGTRDDRQRVRAFFRDYQGSRDRESERNRNDFGLYEFLHDICVAQICAVPAPRHKTLLYTITRALWQVESEFASDGRKAVQDFNKLIAGGADKKLFVGPYNGCSTQAQRAAAGYRKLLRNVLMTANQRGGEVWYLGIVPHPKRWDEADESNAVTCWRFESEKEEADWVQS